MLIFVPPAAGWRTCVFSLVDITPCLVCHICTFWVSYVSEKIVCGFDC